MALYNQIVFALLLLEMGTFVALIVPLPFKARRAMFRFIATSPVIAQAQYFLKIAFVFVGVLFVDAVNRMLKIQADFAAIQDTTGGVRADLHAGSDMRSRKFLSERNMYLYGFTLFLSLILSRTYALVLDLIKAQEDLVLLQAKKDTIAPGSTAEAAKKSQLQLVQLQAEFDTLSKKYNEATGTVSNKRVD